MSATVRNRRKVRQANRAMRHREIPMPCCHLVAPRTPPQYIHDDRTFELKEFFPCNRYEEEHTRSNLVGIHRNDFFLKEAQYEC